jgi:hypothetical protein
MQEVFSFIVPTLLFSDLKKNSKILKFCIMIHGANLAGNSNESTNFMHIMNSGVLFQKCCLCLFLAMDSFICAPKMFV